MNAVHGFRQLSEMSGVNSNSLQDERGGPMIDIHREMGTTSVYSQRMYGQMLLHMGKLKRTSKQKVVKPDT